MLGLLSPGESDALCECSCGQQHPFRLGVALLHIEELGMVADRKAWHLVVLVRLSQLQVWWKWL